MAKAETTTARSPRGTKPVSQSFWTALETIPQANRAAVAKAALVMIRDQLKLQRDKAKAVAVKQKALAGREPPRKPAGKQPVAAKAARKARAMSGKTMAMVDTATPEPKAGSAKRRSRKPAGVPAAM